jgi:TatD DNase family protein
MAPVPMRGKRNEPSFVAIIAQAVAQAYNVSIEELSRQTDSNIERIFGISLP